MRINHKEITTIVPLHKELAPGTLKGVLKLAQIEEKDFWSKV
jgi:predicted RNA binding protein YcfA (HicA-like mRNA interferase family)